MRVISLFLLFWIGLWIGGSAHGSGAVMTSFSFQREADPIEDEAALLTGIYYEGQNVAPPKFTDQGGDKGLLFSHEKETSLLIDPRLLRFGSTGLGISLRVYIDEKPTGTQMLASQQGRFFVLLQGNGSILAKINTTEGMVETAGEGALHVGNWNNVTVRFQNDEVTIYVNGQRVGGREVAGRLVGSANPIALGSSLSGAGSLGEGSENRSRFHFQGVIQRFILTNGELTDEQIWPEQ